MTATPPLDMIENIGDLCRLSEGELQSLAAELRDATIGAVSKTGDHLGAGHLDRGLVVRCMLLPDRMIDHDSQGGQLANVGLNADEIVSALWVMPGLDEASTASSPQSKTSS